MTSQTKCQKPVGPVLRKLMAEQQIRAEEIAYKLDVSYPTVMRWMAGKNEPGRGAARRLGELFGVDWRDFYEQNGEAA